MLPEPVIRILVVDDHPALRQGLAALLAPQGIQVCGEAAGRRDAFERLAELQPDLVLVDLSLDGEDGLPLIAEFRERGIRTLVYSMHHDARRVAAAFAAGAFGYVSKLELQGVLVEAIREVAAWHRFVSPKAGAALVESSIGNPARPDPTRPLSIQETQVFGLLGRGLSTAEIAAALGISPSTAETYLVRLQRKLNTEGMHELRRRAIAAFAAGARTPE
jgi:DNA-binding NarL/FixJ family response regulator